MTERKRRFVVGYEGSVVIELDERVIAAVDDEWRKQMFPIHTAEQIAEHIAYNMVMNRLELEQIDGWADQPNDRAKIIEEDRAEMCAREIPIEHPKIHTARPRPRRKKR